LDCLFLPWNFNCLFTSRSDNYFVISGHILLGKVFITVQINCQSSIEWAYYASSIGKPDLCCYCAAEGIQQDNDLMKKYWVVLPLCQACLRDKKLILNQILLKTDKTWTWCCIIVSSHICWINFEPDKVSFLEDNNKCFTNFIKKKIK
jgi:hypothetical protein